MFFYEKNKKNHPYLFQFKKENLISLTVERLILLQNCYFNTLNKNYKRININAYLFSKYINIDLLFVGGYVFFYGI